MSLDSSSGSGNEAGKEAPGTSGSYQESHPSSPQGKGGATGLVVALVLLVAVAAGVWYFKQSFFPPSPDKILETTRKSMKGVKAFHARYTVGGEAENLGKFSLSLEGDLDMLDPNKVQFQARGDVSGSIMTVAMAFAGETRKVGDDLFFVLQKFNFPIGASSNVQPFINRWFKINVAGAFPTADDIKKLMEQGQGKISAEERSRLEALADKLVTGLKLLQDEEVAGTRCYHLQGQVDKKVLANLMEESFKMEQARAGAVGGGGPDPRQLLGPLKEGLDKYVGDITVDYWIGRQDNLMYRARFALPVQRVDTPRIAIPPFTISGEMAMERYNQPARVEAPPEAVEFPQAREFTKGLKKGLEQLRRGTSQ